MVFDDLPRRTESNTIPDHYLVQDGFPVRQYMCLHSGNKNTTWQWKHSNREYWLSMNHARTMCRIKTDADMFEFPFAILTSDIYFAFGCDENMQIYMVLMGELGHQQYVTKTSLVSNVQGKCPSGVFPVLDEQWYLISHQCDKNASEAVMI